MTQALPAVVDVQPKRLRTWPPRRIVGTQDRLNAVGFDRVRVRDRVGPAAALFDEGEVEQAAAAAQQALDDSARVDSTLVASRLNSLLDAARPYCTTSVEEVRGRAKDLVAARPTTVAA